jgi:hypothetical protein
MPESSKWVLPFVMSDYNIVRLTNLPMRASCPLRLILFDPTILVISGKEHK